MNDVKQLQCWCGSTDLLPFSPEYFRCDKCETLISDCGLSSEEMVVSDDENSFYGRNYWETHVSQDLNQPDVYSRSRTDLTERSLYWLRTVLKYKIPPANVLELGSAHGGFVALLNRAGYEAHGLELSPFIVDFAKKTFDVPMYCGPVESHNIADSSLDIIALMDVIEHLPEPEATMKYCMNLLKPDGIMVIQCPQYIEGKTYQSILDEDDPFNIQLKADEHLNLFSKTSIKMLFDKLGAKNVYFEDAIFSIYDMYLVVCKGECGINTKENIENSLISTANGRFVQAMLDLDDHVQESSKHVKMLQRECDERLNIINILARRLIDEGVDEGEAKRIEYVKNITGLSFD